MAVFDDAVSSDKGNLTSGTTFIDAETGEVDGLHRHEVGTQVEASSDTDYSRAEGTVRVVEKNASRPSQFVTGAHYRDAESSVVEVVDVGDDVEVGDDVVVGNEVEVVDMVVEVVDMVVEVVVVTMSD